MASKKYKFTKPYGGQMNNLYKPGYVIEIDDNNPGLKEFLALGVAEEVKETKEEAKKEDKTK